MSVALGSKLSGRQLELYSGVSRQRVSQIKFKRAVELDPEVELVQWEPVTCHICGLPREDWLQRVDRPLKAAFHNECRWLEFRCHWCGDPVKRRRSEVTARMKRSAYKRLGCGPHGICKKHYFGICHCCGERFKRNTTQRWEFRRSNGRFQHCKDCKEKKLWTTSYCRRRQD